MLASILGMSGLAVATDSESEGLSNEYKLAKMEEGGLSSDRETFSTDDKAEKMLSKLEQGEECSDCELSMEKKTDIKELLFNYAIKFSGQKISRTVKEKTRENLDTLLQEQGEEEVEKLAQMFNDQGMPKRSWFGNDEDAQRRHEIQTKLIQALIESSNEPTVIAERALEEQTKQGEIAEQSAQTNQAQLETARKALQFQKRVSWGGGVGTAAGLIATILLAVFGL